jgi:hypothetical protein
MTTSALVLITIVWITVSLITGYFFYRVLSTPKHAEPDSFSENDEELN